MNWLEDLKVGDEVIVVSGSGWSRVRRVRSVERLTNTQIVIGPERYRRISGRAVGGSDHHRGYLEEATEEAKAELAEKAVRQTLEGKVLGMSPNDWRQLTTDQLRRIKAILDEGGELK